MGRRNKYPVATEDADQEVRLVSCRGCRKALLGELYLAELLRSLKYADWPPLAYKMFRLDLTVKRRITIGEWDCPFCLTCLGEGQHEAVRCYALSINRQARAV